MGNYCRITSWVFCIFLVACTFRKTTFEQVFRSELPQGVQIDNEALIENANVKSYIYYASISGPNDKLELIAKQLGFAKVSHSTDDFWSILPPSSDPRVVAFWTVPDPLEQVKNPQRFILVRGENDRTSFQIYESKAYLFVKRILN